MSTITSSTTAPAHLSPRPRTKPAVTAAPAAPPDSTSLSSEATRPVQPGSVPSFARPTPTRDLPHRLPQTETPEQKKAREQRQLRETDELRRRLDRPVPRDGPGFVSVRDLCDRQRAFPELVRAGAR